MADRYDDRDSDFRPDSRNSDGGGRRQSSQQRGGNRFRRRKPMRRCPDYIDYKDVEFLRTFMPERGKVLPRRISGVSASVQRRIAEAIKRARNIALLPFATD